MIRVTVWNEFRHEQEMPEVKAIYPNGIHAAIAEFLSKNEDMTVRTATLDEPEHGLTDEVLNNTDVLLWWGHAHHNEVSDEVVRKVCQRVNDGMGFIALHSAHASKPFSRLLGTRTDMLRWREDGDMQRLWVTSPGHPIVKGLGDYFEVPHDETYGEQFFIPQPDNLVFISWHPGGEVFRSGCCFVRGGRIFYFQPRNLPGLLSARNPDRHHQCGSLGRAHLSHCADQGLFHRLAALCRAHPHLRKQEVSLFQNNAPLFKRKAGRCF